MKQRTEKRLAAIDATLPDRSATMDWEAALLKRVGLTRQQAIERHGGLPELAYAIVCEPGNGVSMREGETPQTMYMRMLSAKKGS